jgi:hypothetical protein
MLTTTATFSPTERESVATGGSVTGESALEKIRRLDSVGFRAHQLGTAGGRSWPL